VEDVAERSTSETRFADLAERVGEPVRRYVARRVQPHQVDDVVADVFLVLWRRLDDVPAGEPLPWAYGVARNCLANTRRSTRRNLELVDKVTRLDPPREYAAAEPDDDVHHALAQLGDLDRELVQLWAWEGLPPRDIAASLGMTANAVSIRLTRAKQKLGEILRKNDHPSGQEPEEGRTR
jgi:RNA polymerase sigma-70 factor (ECF subfamily)